ncbi:hypothetical protein MLD38_021557 [Melastoma candidum]|uniref:Uncharacterized protein n=1 Tax=Melastoma candidum TaxID=119954 RepID=A0ACB9QGZ7_9MYRT|nr:hypothetical protein MLD38_021557 [Melastoma candidum]
MVIMIGGIVGQVVVEFHPLFEFFYFDSSESLDNVIARLAETFGVTMAIRLICFELCKVLDGGHKLEATWDLFCGKCQFPYTPNERGDGVACHINFDRSVTDIGNDGFHPTDEEIMDSAYKDLLQVIALQLTDEILVCV